MQILLSYLLSSSPLSREAPVLCPCSTGAQDLQQPWALQRFSTLSCCSPGPWQSLHDQVTPSCAGVHFPAFLILKHKQMLQVLSCGESKHKRVFVDFWVGGGFVCFCSLRDGVLVSMSSFLYPVLSALSSATPTCACCSL